MGGAPRAPRRLAPPPPPPPHAAPPAPLPAQLPFVDKGDPDEELANDPLGLKQFAKAFGLNKKKKVEGEGDAGKGGKAGKRK